MGNPSQPTTSDTSGKRLYIETYGCQMNVYDSELVKAILTKADYRLVDREEDADVVMLNTCAIRENAHRKVYGRVHALRHAARGRRLTIGLLGCMATNLRQELLNDRKLRIDFIAGPDSYKRLPDLIRQSALEGKPAYDLTLSEFETYSDVYPRREKGVNAWIAVMRGCNNFCTFCVVPYTRGRERSRSLENIVEETRRLVDEGFRQVTLLGQNVNSYYDGIHDFADLLQAVADVPGIERVRFTSPHPKDFPEHLLNVMAEHPKICRQIHLPLQSGSNRILEKMNRTYTREEFLDLVDRIRSTMPDVCLSTDVIVGFCSETEEDFEDTLDVINRVRFDSAFTFAYSQRKNTIAERKFTDDIPEAVKKERLNRLNDRQRAIGLERNRARIGQEVTLLIEQSPAAKSPDQAMGRTDGNIITLIPRGSVRAGDLVRARVLDATPHALKAEPLV